MAIKVRKLSQVLRTKRAVVRAAPADGAAAVRAGAPRKAKRHGVAMPASPTKRDAVLKVIEKGDVDPGNQLSQRDIAEAAKMVRARKELADLDELRLIDQAVRVKTPQDSIAALLGTSQSTISRIVKRVRQAPSILEPSPSEVINRREIGQIDTAAMMEFLLSSDYGEDGYDPTGGDGFVRGHWRQVEDALVLGLEPRA
ncbi:MAG: hypothetical protein QM695_10450 [Micropruina sp.]